MGKGSTDPADKVAGEDAGRDAGNKEKDMGNNPGQDLDAAGKGSGNTDEDMGTHAGEDAGKEAGKDAGKKDDLGQDVGNDNSLAFGVLILVYHDVVAFITLLSEG